MLFYILTEKKHDSTKSTLFYHSKSQQMYLSNLSAKFKLKAFDKIKVPILNLYYYFAYIHILIKKNSLMFRKGMEHPIPLNTLGRKSVYILRVQTIDNFCRYVDKYYVLLYVHRLFFNWKNCIQKVKHFLRTSDKNLLLSLGI